MANCRVVFIVVLSIVTVRKVVSREACTIVLKRCRRTTMSRNPARPSRHDFTFRRAQTAPMCSKLHVWRARSAYNRLVHHGRGGRGELAGGAERGRTRPSGRVGVNRRRQQKTWRHCAAAASSARLEPRERTFPPVAWTRCVRRGARGSRSIEPGRGTSSSDERAPRHGVTACAVFRDERSPRPTRDISSRLDNIVRRLTASPFSPKRQVSFFLCEIPFFLSHAVTSRAPLSFSPSLSSFFGSFLSRALCFRLRLSPFSGLCLSLSSTSLAVLSNRAISFYSRSIYPRLDSICISPPSLSCDVMWERAGSVRVCSPNTRCHS